MNPAEAALRRHAASLPLAVAYSGGADSTALLHAAALLWPGQVQALHVHHGIQSAADDFVRHCETVCDALRVPLHIVHVDARHQPGESPEEAARHARYAALAGAARAGQLRAVLLAHHADDQVESILLALSRGAGIAGLAAMAAGFERHGMRFARPLLQVPAPVLRRWLQQSGIAWVEDPTNADPRRTRSRIRHDLLPALEAAFPQFRETFARSARHAAQAQSQLTVLARRDLQDMGGQPSITALQRLPDEARSNLLRHWLRDAHGARVSTAQIEELLAQVEACRTRGHQIRIKVGTGLVQRDGDRLVFVPPL